jgi:hypothetical protein
MIVNLNDLKDFANQYDSLKQKLLNGGHLLLRGLFSEAEIKSVREEFLKVYRSLEPRGTTNVQPSEIVDNDLLKFSIGQFSGAQSIPRFFLILYRNDETLSASEKLVFDRLVRLWEVMQGKSFTKEELDRNGSFFAKRYQYYPSGGGFLCTHADSYNVDTSKKIGGEFIQFVLPITQKGIDYTEGGGYVIVDGKQVSNEDAIELGDLIVYDGSIEHGVSDIDPFRPLNLDGSSGRVVMFITLYKKLKDK